MATKWSSRWFFLYEFGKNERASVSGKELKALQEIATVLLELDDRQVAAAMAAGEIAEVRDDDDPT